MEKARKAINDQILKDTQLKVCELAKSEEIWKRRSKALDVEMTVLRVQVQKLISKSEFDNQLIDQLKVLLTYYNININIIYELLFVLYIHRLS